MLSTAWEAAGGEAIRYDQRRDEREDFMKDDTFWNDHLAHPRDFYHFALPCHHMSIARTTPFKARSVDNPSGDERDEETSYYNGMCDLMCSRIWKLVAKGAAVLTEQPLLTYLYLRRVARMFIGAPGVLAFRSDDCMVSGTPGRNQGGGLQRVAGLQRVRR